MHGLVLGLTDECVNFSDSNNACKHAMTASRALLTPNSFQCSDKKLSAIQHTLRMYPVEYSNILTESRALLA